MLIIKNVLNIKQNKLTLANFMRGKKNVKKLCVLQIID